MYKVEIASLDEFKNSKEAWNRLVLKMYIPSVFCTWEWIYTWWEHFGDNYKLLILFVFSGSELKGILPLASRDIVLNRAGLTGRILTYCGSVEVAPDHLDIIASKEDAADCLNSIIKYLSTEYTVWDVIHASHVSESNHLITWVNDTTLPFQRRVHEISVSPFISLSEGFEQYVDSFHSKKKYMIKKMEKTQNDRYGIRCFTCDPSKYEETLNILFELHEKRAKKKQIESTFKKAQIIKFHHALIQRMKKTDWLWLRVLKSNEKIISVLYAFAFGKKVDYYQLGFDPDWEQYGPGKFHIFMMIKEAFSKNYAEFDFLRGDEEYKSYWTKKRRALLIANIYNNTWRGRISNTLYNTKLVLKKVINTIYGNSTGKGAQRSAKVR